MLLSPHQILQQLANALPPEIRGNVIIVGSLAAAVRFFPPDDSIGVRTKDVDCLLSPRLHALASGKQATEALMAGNWKIRKGDTWDQPGDSNTPTDRLPLVRLVPPGGSDWFLELLSAPDVEQEPGREFQRLETQYGHFALCSFRFLALAECSPIVTECGIKVARPEMMALANLLHHPTIRPETMSGLIEGRSIKRANKDLGRVLALAFLADRADHTTLESWPESWAAALQERFSGEADMLLAKIGNGLEHLLDDSHGADLEEAHHTCINGLLAGHRPQLDTLRGIGQRVLLDVIMPARKLTSPGTNVRSPLPYHSARNQT